MAVVAIEIIVTTHTSGVSLYVRHCSKHLKCISSQKPYKVGLFSFPFTMRHKEGCSDCPVKGWSHDLNPDTNVCWAKLRSWISPFNPHNYSLSRYHPWGPGQDPWLRFSFPEVLTAAVHPGHHRAGNCSLWAWTGRFILLTMKSTSSGLWYLIVVPPVSLSPPDITLRKLSYIQHPEWVTPGLPAVKRLPGRAVWGSGLSCSNLA